MRLPGWPGWGDGPPGRAVPPARRLLCCPPPPPPPCCAAFIIFLYLLLLFWNQIFTCNKNPTRERSGQVELVSRVVSSYWRKRPKRWGEKRMKKTRPRTKKERKTKRTCESQHEVDVLFNVDRDGVYGCGRQRPAIFTVSVAAVLPSVKHPIITEADMNFCQYAPRVMIHACSAWHTYIFCKRDKRT